MKKLLLVLMLATLACIIFAQVSDYTFGYSAGTYTEITGGTVLGTAEVGATGVPALDNVFYTGTPIPFLFGVNGRQYNQVAVSSNGYLIFGGTTIFAESSQISSTYAAEAVVVILGRDLQGNVVTAGNLGEMRYQTLGTAPTRVFVVQWKNFIRYSSGGNTENYNFQVELHEGSNVIKYVYGPMTVLATSITCQVGMRGTTNADYLARTTTTDWAATTAGGTNAATMALSSTIYPSNGTTYTFTPPAPTTFPNLAAIVSPTDTATNVFATATLNWSDGGGWANGFKLYFGTVNPPPLVGDLGYVLSYDPPGDMVFNTPHYWKVVPYNGFGDNTSAVVWSFTTAGAPLTGTKTIGTGGDYATFTLAINALNGAGVGAGGVIFNVANETFNENPPAINVNGTASNQIKFQALTGNPVVTPAGGALTFGFKLNGADYVTFDNIDISAPNTVIYGYWLAGLTGNGANNNIIKNCSITLPYGSSTNYGIYSLGVTDGANSNNVFFQNTITSPYHGIYFTGSSTAGSEAQNTTIQGNSMSNLRNYAIYHGYAINSMISGNNIAFTLGGTTSYYGVYSFGSATTGTVLNNNLTGGYTSSTVYGFYNSSGYVNYTGNTITNLYNTSSSGWYGFYAGGGGTTWTNNTISGITNTGTAAVYAAYITTGDHTFIGNNIYDIATGGTSLYGVYVIGGTTHTIQRNKVYNLRYTGTGSGIIYGIHIGSGTTNNVYNNMVYDLRAAGTTGTAPQVRGISISSGTTDNIWYNTVYLNSTGTGTTFSTAALYVSASTNTIDLKNNIFDNKSTPGATGRTVAFWKSSAGVSNLSTESNKNIYYAGTPGASNLIGYFSTTAYQILDDYKTMAATKDQGSFTEDVHFVSSSEPYDVHINPAVQTRVEGNAVVIATVTNDYDGNTRNATTPDIGADEGTFTPVSGPPGDVTLLSPIDESEGFDPNNPIVTWSAPTTGGTPTYYVVYIADSEGGIYDGFTPEVTHPATSLNLSTVPGLNLGFLNTWYWAVQAVNGSGSSDPSAVWNFTTKAQLQASTTLALGNVWPGAERTGNIPIQNIGSTALTFDVYGPAEFAFGTPTRYTIPASSTVNLPYTFTAPMTPGAYANTITLEQTGPELSTTVINVTANITSDTTVGTGTAELGIPVDPYFGYSYSQTMYYPTDLPWPSNYRIEKLYYYYNGFETAEVTKEFVIYMGHTNSATFASTTSWIPVASLTQVYNQINIPQLVPGGYWMEFVLDTPFLYNGTDNLVIAVDENFAGYETTDAYFYCTATTGVNRSIFYRNDSTNPDPTAPPTGTLAAGYPNTKFFVAPVPTMPQILVSPASWFFGTVIINTTNTKQFTIQNTGAGTLSISSIAPASSGYFTLTGLPTFPVNLTTGQTTTFSVQYLPTAAGAHSAAFNINDNRGTTPVNVTGICVDPRITSLPHAQNFDDVTVPALPLGWSPNVYSATSPTYVYVKTTTTTPHTSPNNVGFYNSGDTGATLMLVSPQITVGISNIKMSFWARYSSYASNLIIGTMSDPANAATFVPFTTISDLTTTNTQRIVSFALYGGADQYIAFKMTSASTYAYIYLDTILMEQLMPNDLAATLITGPTQIQVGTPLTYNVTVVNNGTATAASYNVHLKRYGDDRYASITVITPLAPGATAVHAINWTPVIADLYQFVGEAELTSAVDGNATNNETAILNLFAYPEGTWVEDFEGGAIPSDWTIRTGDTGSYNWVIYNTGAHGGTYCARVRWESSLIDNDDWLITPPLQLSSTRPDAISFWLGKTSTSWPEDWEVLVSTTDSQISSFSRIDFGDLANIGYTQKIYSLDSYGDAVVYIAVRYVGTNDFYLYADDFIGSPLYVPAEPVVTIENVPTGVRLSWPADIHVKHYKIYADDDPYGTFTGTPITTTSNEYIITTPEAKKFYKVVASTKEIGGRESDLPVFNNVVTPEELEKLRNQ